MKKLNQIFLQFLKSAIHGLPVEETPDMQALTLAEWQELINLALAHKVLPLIYDVVYNLPAFQQQEDSFKTSLRSTIIQQLSLQTMRTVEFLKLNKMLQDQDIKPIVVKGLVCRSIYPKLDSRPSSDEDVLVAPENYAKSQSILQEFGLIMADEELRARDEYEVTYRMPDGLMTIELHRRLFDSEDKSYGEFNKFFENIFEHVIEMQIEESRVYTLEPTYHLLFMICHAFKHFIYSGCGIRQICDVLMLADKYGAEIDWQYIKNSCREMNLEVFTIAIFKIGCRHLGFDLQKAACPKDWQEYDIDEAPMLEDLLDAGVFGVTTLSRGHSGRITLNAVAAEKQGSNSKLAVLRTVFPSVRSLRQQYPYLSKRPYLVPVAWVSRIFRYGCEMVKTKDNSTAESIKIGQQRVELLRYYGVLDK